MSLFPQMEDFSMDYMDLIYLGRVTNSSSTLSVIAGMDAVSRHRDILVLVVQWFQEGHQVLVVGQLLCNRERHHHHVDRWVTFSEGAEQWGDGTVQLLHGTPRRGWWIAVVLGVAHPWHWKEYLEKLKGQFPKKLPPCVVIVIIKLPIKITF